MPPHKNQSPQSTVCLYTLLGINEVADYPPESVTKILTERREVDEALARYRAHMHHLAEYAVHC